MPKIQLSAEEMQLVCNREWILTKHRIIEKVYQLFGSLSAKMQTYLGHPVRVQKFVLPGGADICQILFIARNESRRIGDVLKSVEGKPVLTVSDIDHFTREGGMLGFVLVDNRVRFTVNPARTSKAGILISSKLLQLAVAVEAGGAN